MHLNFNKFRAIRLAIFFCLLTAAFLLFLDVSTFAKKSVLVDFNGERRDINLPFTSSSADDKDFVFITDFKKKLLNPRWIKIIPDDGVTEMKINDENIPLNIRNKNLLWNVEKGFDYPIGKYLSKKINTADTLEIKIHNNKGEYGLKIKPSFNDPVFISILILFYLFAGLFIFEALRLFSINKKIIIIFIFALLVRLIYISITDWNVRGHDVNAHVDYIEYIVKHNALPDSRAGWEYHQPPFYYAVSALIYKTLNLFGIETKAVIYKTLQGFSLLVDIGILILAYLIFKFVFKNLKLPLNQGNKNLLSSRMYNKTAFRFKRGMTDNFNKIEIQKENFMLLSFSLFAFLPSHIIHSIKISNDVFSWFFYLLTFLFFIYWMEDPKVKYLSLFLISAFLAVFSKKSGIVIIPVFYLSVGLKYLLDSRKKINKKFYIKNILIITIAVIVILGSVFFKPVYNNLSGKKENLMVGSTNHGLNRGLFVENYTYNYFYFDLKTFLTKPFTHPFDDSYGRQYFLNYLFKTSLFGEFSFSSFYLKNIGALISLLFFLMLIYTIAAFCLFDKKLIICISVLIFNTVFQFLSLFFYRMMVPAACNNDFRFIFPILLSTPVFYVLSIYEFKKRNYKKLYYAGYLLSFLFIALNLLFFLFLAVQ